MERLLLFLLDILVIAAVVIIVLSFVQTCTN